MKRVWMLGLLAVGCGGSCPEAKSSAEPPSASEPESKSTETEETPPPPAQDVAAPAEPATEKHEEKAEDPVINPEFPEGASVAQAMAAIPKGVPRANVDAETLGAPLESESVYAPCKVGAQHFKLKVAVWNGRAVGVDVTTPNKQLAACIDKQVRNLTWTTAVRSLNTVEYSM